MISNIIKKYEDVALSNKDILCLLNDKANIVLYPNLYKYNNIDELLQPYGAFVLLFEAKPKYGHWTCVFKVDNRTLEFFNPYGGFPDDALERIPQDFSLVSNQNHTYLSKLFIESPYNLTYNQYPFQKEEEDIRTCGRHCVVRLLCRQMTLDGYYVFMRQLSQILNMDFDEIVTILTM